MAHSETSPPKQGLLTPATPTSPHSWRTLFRAPSMNALRKQSTNLTLDTAAGPQQHPTGPQLAQPRAEASQPSTPTFELTLDSRPGSAQRLGPMTPASAGGRDSYNSSMSIESLGQQLPPTLNPSASATTTTTTTTITATSTPSATTPHTAHPTRPEPARSESKYGSLLSRSRSKIALALQTSSQDSTPADATRSPARGPMSPLSPKAVGRFIRRVASAPNAKGLFTSGASRSANGGPPTTKNGLLSPYDVPPVPELTDGSRTNSENDNSLETDASPGSSRGRAPPVRSLSADMLGKKRSTDKLKAATATGPQPVGSGPAPGRAVFRRTYSSNSIKVKQVRTPLPDMTVDQTP